MKEKRQDIEKLKKQGIMIEKSKKTSGKKPEKKAEKAKTKTRAQKAAKERRERKELREKVRRERKLGFRRGGFPIQKVTKTKRTWTPSKDESNKRVEEKTQQCSLKVFEPVKHKAAYTGAGGSA